MLIDRQIYRKSSFTCKTRYMEKKYPYCFNLWCHHSMIMADFLMPETIIFIILIIHYTYFLKFLVEL